MNLVLSNMQNAMELFKFTYGLKNSDNTTFNNARFIRTNFRITRLKLAKNLNKLSKFLV